MLGDSDAQATLRESLKAALRQHLPDYMVPAFLLFLEQLPLTPNGKLDRKALPAVDGSQQQREHVAPRSALEKSLAAIWQDVLAIDNVGLEDNFFELGGDSIVSMQVVSRARQAGIVLSPKDLFQHQTIRSLAQAAAQLASNRRSTKARPAAPWRWRRCSNGSSNKPSPSASTGTSRCCWCRASR